MLKRILSIMLGLAFGSFLSAGNDRLETTSSDRLQITLSRFDFDRVAAAQKYFEARMRKTKTAIGAVIGTGAVAVGGGLYWHWQKSRKTRQEMEGVNALLREIGSSRVSEGQAKQVDNLLKVQKLKQFRDNSDTIKDKKNVGWLENFIQQPLKITLWGGLALIILASGHQAFRVLSGTIEDVFQLWWHGYEHWYASYEEQVRTIMNQLREAFYQARKAAQQTSTEQQLLIARQQRRAQLSYEVSSHYRLDIVTLYQRLVSSLERLVALMFILSPDEHHPLMQQHLAAIQSQVRRVAESLECDLNENTHGMLTHYSNGTLDSYHECVESISIFLTTYRTYLPK